MTQNIHILPENLVNQIAAGEVVERPSSVVKELIENSIDAGSTDITIEIKEGGKRLIKITDNGHGIKKDDLKNAITRHATSKITSEEDLQKIHTMGFRGEALASIGSVSELTISSRVSSQNEIDQDDTFNSTDHGFTLTCAGGQYTDISPVGMPVGTVVEVRHLFYNTPARLKFMKTDQTEKNHITKYIEEVALINPHVHFKCIVDSKLTINYVPVQKLSERIAQVCGSHIAKDILEVHYLGTDMNLSGFIGKPQIARSNRNSQYLFVNERPVKNYTVSAAVQKAFHSLLPHGKFPFFVLNLHLPFEKVDVNVHPRKLEVKFLYNNEMFKLIESAVKKALENSHLSPSFEDSSSSYWNTEHKFSKSLQNSNIENSSPQKTSSSSFYESGYSTPAPSNQSTTYKPSEQKINEALSFTQEFLREHAPVDEKPSLKALCQVENSYIVASSKDGLKVIDQHAAHERILYNKFLHQARMQAHNKDVETQKLLMPETIELSIAEVQLLEKHLDTLNSIGFEIESFGGSTFHVHSVPSSLIKTDIQTLILEVIDDLKNGDPTKLKEPQHQAICYMACRGAIKFGDPLTMIEMQSLLDQMLRQDQMYTCPHGRPTMIDLTFQELEKRFGRK